MIKAIIFDCFGVLVGRGFWAIYQELGGDPIADEEFIDEWLNKANTGSISSEKFSNAMAKKLNLSLEKYNDAFKRDEVPNEEVFEYIAKTLKPNYKLALVSNATGNSVRRKIPEEKLALFDEVFISAEVGLLKPDAKLFQLALDRLGVRAGETVFVDDHQKYIDGANAVGLQTILFRSLDDLQTNIEQLAG
mgnify:CR=1 FL=1